MPPSTINDWLAAKVIGISKQEIIERYRTYNGKSNISRMTRARLTVVEGDIRNPRPRLIVAMQQDDGRWSERRGTLRWSMGKFSDPTEVYDVFVVTTNLTYAGWTNAEAGKGMIGFLRIGRQGAIFLMANGQRTIIGQPPAYKRPHTHLQNLHAGIDGFLSHVSVPNQAYEDWRLWEREVSAALDFCRRRSELTGLRIDPGEYAKDRKAICQLCGIHAAQDRDPQSNWRIAGISGRLFFCSKCNEGRS